MAFYFFNGKDFNKTLHSQQSTWSLLLLFAFVAITGLASLLSILSFF